jgi:uncharacterized SAM-binding protein YcdF (DUF218 family)
MSAPKLAHRIRLWVLCVLLAIAAAVTATLRWGGYLLIEGDRLPAHVDAAIVLQGSTEAEKVRVAGAMNLLRQGIAQNVLLSIPPHLFWDEPALPAAHAYLERKYGPDATQRVYFCEVGPNVNSTEGEAMYLETCIRERGWKSIAVVTSNYHSRRAAMLWRRMLRHQNSGTEFCLYEVPDPDFQAQGWWRKRLYAKTWFFEFTKLIWAVFSW